MTNIPLKLADLTNRIDLLEEQVSALAAAMAQHQVGATARQSEIDWLRAENERLRWAVQTGRPL